MIAALAHNLLRWTSVIGLPGQTIRAARTLRRRLLALPGRLTRTARRWTLHLPARWPWRDAFTEALTRIRALPSRGLNADQQLTSHHARPGAPSAALTTSRRPPESPTRPPPRQRHPRTDLTPDATTHPNTTTPISPPAQRADRSVDRG